MRTQGMSEDINVRIAGQVTSEGLVIGWAFVHCNLLDALSAHRAIATHQIEEELDLRPCGGNSAAGSEGLRTAHRGARRAEARGDFRGARSDTARPLLAAGNPRPNKARTNRRGARARPRLPAVGGEVPRDGPKSCTAKRADDLVDLEGRLLREMAGVKTTALEMMPSGRVLVAHRLLPSETVALPRRAVTGIVLEFGGPGSHAALFARALGIPTVAQIPNATKRIVDGQELIVDGIAGEVILSPDPAMRARFEEKISSLQGRLLRAKRLAGQPARTVDGTEVAVMANVGCREDVIAAAENGADGVGLYRIEQFYLSRNTPPSAGELLAELRLAFAPLAGKPITVRLLDLGADRCRI